MRPPWDPSAQNAAELEALQTDVMRFIAIIGLCLMAVFSLVNGAAQEQRATRTHPAEASRGESPTAPAVVNRAIPEDAPSPTRQPTPPKQPAARPLQTPRPSPNPNAAAEPPPESVSVAQGFTLEFESADALAALLAAGRITLFARGEQQHWRYQFGSGFAPAEAPNSYYPMHPETVPAKLRNLAAGKLNTAPTAWGVTLPSATSRKIQQLMTERTGGALLIDADGEVRLEDGGA